MLNLYVRVACWLPLVAWFAVLALDKRIVDVLFTPTESSAAQRLGYRGLLIAILLLAFPAAVRLALRGAYGARALVPSRDQRLLKIASVFFAVASLCMFGAAIVALVTLRGRP